MKTETIAKQVHQRRRKLNDDLLKAIKEFEESTGFRVTGVRLASDLTAVSYTHLTLPTNREV